jgi:hypothetical protein
MTHLWLDKTPNLGVHQTGSSSIYAIKLAPIDDGIAFHQRKRGLQLALFLRLSLQTR